MARSNEKVSASNERPPRAPVGSTYNFHGLYSVRVVHSALDALMRRELGQFLTPVDGPDLTIEEGPVPRLPRSLPDPYRYDESSFVVQTSTGRIAIRKGTIRAEPRVKPIELLEFWVENLMKKAILRRGASFIHASAVSRDGAASLFPAWIGTGKTQVLLHALAQGYDYMADDWCFLSESGDALAYPRWAYLKYNHFRSYLPLRTLLTPGRSGADLRRRLRVNDFASSLRPSGPVARRFQRFLTDRFFVEVHANPTQIFPQARCILRSPVARVVLLISSDQRDVEVRRIPPEEAARRTSLAGGYERSRQEEHWIAVAYAGHEVPLGGTIGQETALLSRAMAAARCYEVVLPENPERADVDRVLSETE